MKNGEKLRSYAKYSVPIDILPVMSVLNNTYMTLTQILKPIEVMVLRGADFPPKES
jgi:hypothetical protein